MQACLALLQLPSWCACRTHTDPQREVVWPLSQGQPHPLWKWEIRGAFAQLRSVSHPEAGAAPSFLPGETSGTYSREDGSSGSALPGASSQSLPPAIGCSPAHWQTPGLASLHIRGPAALPPDKTTASMMAVLQN